jgi:hypothetical protein
MNTGRIVLGGLLAGLVMNVIEFVTNAVLLQPRWTAESVKLGLDMAKVGASSAIGWVVTDFLTGILLVWLYAAIRPRFGAGAKTGLLAGFVMWLITRLWFTSWAFNGLYSVQLVALCSLGGLVATLLGGLVGGAMYKEKAA